MRRLFIIAAIIVMASTSKVTAVPIYTIDGTINSFNLSSNGVTFTLSFGVSQVTMHNGGVIAPIPTTFDSITGNAIPIGVSAGLTHYQLTSPAGNDDKTITQGGSATFDFSGLVFSVVNAFPNIAFINGNDVLTSNTTAIDYSPFSFGGLVSITLNANPASSNFNSVIATNGGGAAGSASFSQAAVDPVVPEPSTFVMVSMFVALFGGGLLLRRRSSNCAAALPA